MENKEFNKLNSRKWSDWKTALKGDKLGTVKDFFRGWGEATKKEFAKNVEWFKANATKTGRHKTAEEKRRQAQERAAIAVAKAVAETSEIVKMLRVDLIKVRVAYAEPEKYRVGITAVRTIEPCNTGWQGLKRLVGLVPPPAKILWTRQED